MSEGFKNTFLENLSKFEKEDKEIFDRIYKVLENKGELVPPTEMTSWIESTFGSVEAVTHQDFLRITNVITYEGAIFNELRTKRPVVGDTNFSEVVETIEAAKNSPFSKPLTGTPADVFGRIKGEYSMTASNIAKYDGLHGLIIFNEHDPLLFARKRVRDYFDVAQKWFAEAHKHDPNSIYPFYTWNCLWKAAASIIHGHCQLALAAGQAYSKVEEMRSLTLNYQETFRRAYFDDIYNIHEKLGLAFERDGVKLMVKITPIKEKEVMILSDNFDNTLADVVSDTLNTMKETLAVSSFNLSIILPPLENTLENWDHMPVVTRIVDRGKLSSKTADMGSMELYAQSVIETNPYVVYEKLSKALLDGR